MGIRFLRRLGPGPAETLDSPVGRGVGIEKCYPAARGLSSDRSTLWKQAVVSTQVGERIVPELAALVPAGPDEARRMVRLDWEHLNKHRMAWSERWQHEIGA